MKKYYFYGFKNIKTGLFARDYLTVRYKTKTAVFKSKLQAEKAFNINKLHHNYIIAEIVEIEEK